MLERGPKRLVKKAKRGFWGYPVATVALYGPDDVTATKVAVGIVPAEGAETSNVRRWLSNGSDIRRDLQVAADGLRGDKPDTPGRSTAMSVYCSMMANGLRSMCSRCICP